MCSKSWYSGFGQPFNGLCPSKHCISPGCRATLVCSQMPGCCRQKQAVQLEDKEENMPVCLSLGENIVQYKCKNPPLQRTPPFSPAPIQRVLTTVFLGKPGPCGLAATRGLLRIGFVALFKLYQHFFCVLNFEIHCLTWLLLLTFSRLRMSVSTVPISGCTVQGV